MAFSIGQLQFLDSLQFTMQSLDELVKTLDDEDFEYTKKSYVDEMKFDLIKKKGVFPYDFFDDISKLKYTKFPTRKQFFNKLADTECNMKDYLHAKLVWKTFNCKNFGDYHDIYLKTDVLLLTDFFEKYRKTCLSNYGLDSAHYYSAPSMAWDAALKMTKVELELFDNEQMYSFIEHSIRGGVCMISKRYAKANNPGCKIFDPLKPISHLIYLDANNLYGWAMSQSLPVKEFRWMNDDEITRDPDDILRLLDDAEDGYIYEVDCSYPQDLHSSHSDYPLAPERVTIEESMLSPFQQKNFPSCQKKPQTKLTPNLNNKSNYVLHYRNLKFYIQQGLVITKIHRVLTFKQSAWLAPYIDYNTKCRAASKSKFGKEYYKLMNNAVFGKTNENLRNRMRVEAITDRKIALKRVCLPSFKRSQTIHEDLVIMQTATSNLNLCKPIYVGFSILDISKLLMYKFHYEKMIPKYKDKIALCFTDTDSLLYEVQTDDIYEDMRGSDDYDFSEYPFTHYLYNEKNKKVIGKMKDEINSITIEEFIGLRPKCYSLLFNGIVKDNLIMNTDLNEKQAAKGTKKSVKDTHLRHARYKDVHKSLSVITVGQNIIKSKTHNISTYHMKKIGLSAYDTKRWICDDNIHTRAHGHHKNKQ